MKRYIIALMLLSLSACLDSVGASSENETVDLTKQSTAKNKVTALLVTNVNGNSSGNAEAIGDLPTPSSTLFSKGARRSTTSNELKPLYKDRFSKTLFQPGRVPSQKSLDTLKTPRFSLTEKDEEHTFYATDTQGNNITVEASLKYGTADSKCLIYLEDGALDDVYADYDFSEVGEVFDSTIYERVTEGFANETDIDSNSKIVILFFDMTGDLSGDSYVGEDYLGFFYSADLYTQSIIDENNFTNQYGDLIKSNEMELFYLNIGWSKSENYLYTKEAASDDSSVDFASLPSSDPMLRTLAHEFQHMVNFGQRVMVEGLQPLDTWIDEGLAESAEHYVFEKVGEARINWFNSDPNDSIRNGLSLCNWTGDVAHYSLSYLFMQYLRIHSASGDGIYSKIVQHNSGSYSSIVSVMSQEHSEFDSFSKIVRSFYLANLLQQESGIFGYGDEAESFSLIVRGPTSSVSSINLSPGASVALPFNDFETISALVGYGKGENIRLSTVQSGTVIDF